MTLNLMKTALLAGTAVAIAAIPYVYSDVANADDMSAKRTPHMASVPGTGDPAPAAHRRFEQIPATPGFKDDFKTPRSFADFAPIVAQSGAPAGQHGGFPPLGFDPTTDPSPNAVKRTTEPVYPTRAPAPRYDATRTAPAAPYPSAQSSTQPGVWPSVPNVPAAAPSATTAQPYQPAPYYGTPTTAPSYPQAAPSYPQAAPSYPTAPAAPAYAAPRPASPAYAAPQQAPAYPPAPSYRQQPAPYPTAAPQAPAYGGYRTQQRAPNYSQPAAAPTYPGYGYAAPAPRAPAYGAPNYGRQGQWSVQRGYAPNYGYAAPPAGWTPGWAPMPYPAYPSAPYGYQPAYPGYGSPYGTPARQPAVRPAPAAPAYRQPAPAPRRPERSGGNLWATGEGALAASQPTAKQRFIAGTVSPSAETAYRRAGIYAPAAGFDWERNLPGGAPAPIAERRPAAPLATAKTETMPHAPVTCSFQTGCVAANRFDDAGPGTRTSRPAYTTQWSSAMFDASSFYDGTDLR